jgi:hypothetical protein
MNPQYESAAVDIVDVDARGLTASTYQCGLGEPANELCTASEEGGNVTGTCTANEEVRLDPDDIESIGSMSSEDDCPDPLPRLAHNEVAEQLRTGPDVSGRHFGRCVRFKCASVMCKDIATYETMCRKTLRLDECPRTGICLLSEHGSHNSNHQDPSDPRGLTDTAKTFVADQLKYSRATAKPIWMALREKFEGTVHADVTKEQV